MSSISVKKSAFIYRTVSAGFPIIHQNESQLLKCLNGEITDNMAMLLYGRLIVICHWNLYISPPAMSLQSAMTTVCCFMFSHQGEVASEHTPKAAHLACSTHCSCSPNMQLWNVMCEGRMNTLYAIVKKQQSSKLNLILSCYFLSRLALIVAADTSNTTVTTATTTTTTTTTTTIIVTITISTTTATTTITTTVSTTATYSSHYRYHSPCYYNFQHTFYSVILLLSPHHRNILY